MCCPDEHQSPSRGKAVFPQTRWTVILDAQNQAPTALASFCSAYWFPLYSYARGMKLSPANAEDLTQSFFERLLTRDILNHARRERGRLRDFLLRTFKNYAVEEWRRSQAQKRSARQPTLQIDGMEAEERFNLELQSQVTPEREYERAWARELLRQALQRLERSYQASGNLAVFLALRDRLAEGFSDQSYRETAAALGKSEPAVRFAAFKLRQRYRELLRELVAETVSQEAEVDAELQYLQTLFGD